MEALAFTLDLIGKIMIAYTAIRVHHRFWKEHKIDEVVFREMGQEQNIGIAGIFFMIGGYMIHLIILL